MTIWLIDYLNSLEKKCMVLTRGYKGELEKSSGIIRSSQSLLFDPADYGDEPLLLANHIKEGAVVVGRERVKNFKRYFQQVYPDVVLLDDGYQYLKMTRDLNIALFDLLMDIDLYKTPPLGRLREGVRALSDADVICLTRSDLVSEEKIIALKNLLQKHLRPETLFVEVAYNPTALLNGSYGVVLSIGELKGKKVIAICGLASPQSFFQNLELLGADLILKRSYRDHCSYNLQEINSLLRMAEEQNAIIVTTEKDMIKIRKLVMSKRLLFLGISIEFRKGEKEFKQRINRILIHSSLSTKDTHS